MAEAVFALIGAVLGGVLVLIGDQVARRSELELRRLDQLRDAASEVAGTYGTALTRMIGARREVGPTELGRPGTEELQFPERYRAWSRLFMLPGSEELRPALQQLSDLNYDLVTNFDLMSDDDFNAAVADVSQSLTDFEHLVQRLTCYEPRLWPPGSRARHLRPGDEVGAPIDLRVATGRGRKKPSWVRPDSS